MFVRKVVMHSIWVGVSLAIKTISIKGIKTDNLPNPYCRGTHITSYKFNHGSHNEGKLQFRTVWDVYVQAIYASFDCFSTLTLPQKGNSDLYLSAHDEINVLLTLPCTPPLPLSSLHDFTSRTSKSDFAWVGFFSRSQAIRLRRFLLYMQIVNHGCQ